MSTQPSLPHCVAIAGLGLMGGSLARDLLALGVRVLAHDRDPDTLRAAAAAGAIPLDDLEASTLAEAELLVIALPVTAATPALTRLVPALGAHCLVTDLGSTKRSIGRAAEQAGIGERFVGSHPLAGDHRSGWAVGSRGLFADARVYLCPTPRTLPRTLETVRALWVALGARTEEIDPVEHDRRLAWTSHLPQVASSALASVLAEAGLGKAELGRGGREFTRLAGSSPEMWEAICRDNAEQIVPTLTALERRIAALRAALERGDASGVRHFFQDASDWWWRDEPAP